MYIYIYTYGYIERGVRYKVAVAPAPRRRQRRNRGTVIYVPEVQSFAVLPPVLARRKHAKRGRRTRGNRDPYQSNERLPCTRSAAVQTFPSHRRVDPPAHGKPATTRRRFDEKFGEMRPRGPAVVSPYF